jgi:hypothetical protein
MRAIGRFDLREAGLLRGLGGARADREGRKARERGPVRMRRQGARRIRAGDQHRRVGAGEFACDRFHVHERGDYDRVSARAQRVGGARRIGFGPRHQEAHVRPQRSLAARAP